MLRSGADQLKTQLVAILLVMALPSLVLLAWDFAREWSHALTIAELQTKSISDGVSRDLWGTLRDYRAVSAELAKRPEVSGSDPARCVEFLGTYASAHPEIIALTVRDSSGRTECSSLPRVNPQMRDDVLPFLKETIRTGEPQMTDLVIGSITKKAVVILTYPIHRISGVDSVLLVSVDLAEYSRRLLSDLPANMSVTIVDKNMKVVAKKPDLHDRVGKAPEPRIIRAIVGRHDGTLRQIDANRRSLIGAFVTEPTSDWVVFASTPEDVVLAPQRSRLISTLGAALFVMILLAVAMVKVADALSRPLQALANTARQAADGNLDARAPEAGSAEVREVAQQFNKMLEAQDRSRTAQKMEAVGRLASGIAHDFNNLLGIIGSSAEVIDHQIKRGEDTSASTSLIVRACERGRDLTSRLLIFSRKSNAHPAQIQVQAVLDDLMSVLRRTLGAGIAVKMTNRCTEAHIFADASLFYTALYNLAINAKDAMPGGGTISLAVDCERCRMGGQQESDVVVVSVSDTGTGMPADMTRKIFEPFFTTKEAGKGTGLGLAMVYGFVTDAGGEISVQSKLNSGTTFFMRFPSCEPPLGSRAPKEIAPRQPASRTILLVEDNEDLRDVMQIRLQRMGFSVDAVATARDALTLAVNKGFDVLLTDFQLGAPMNGAALAREVEKLAPNIGVIVTSGYLSLDDAKTLDPRWALLEKPASQEELVKALSFTTGAHAAAPSPMRATA